MKTEHFPSLELCKKLTAIGFPETEHQWKVNEDGIIEGIIFNNEKFKDDWYFVCPSVMEMLDVMPKTITRAFLEYEILISKDGVGYFGKRLRSIKEIDNGNIPNALAEMILWLHENN